MNTHHAQIKSKTRVYQLASLTALIGVGAAAALPLKATFAPKPQKIFNPGNTVEPSTPRPELAMSVNDAAIVLKNVINWSGERITAAVEPMVEPTTSPTVQPPQNEWSYLGSIIMAGKAQALVRIDMQQHMLAPGAELNQTKLLTIDPGFITINKDGKDHRVYLASRTSVFPTEPPKRPVAVRPGGPINIPAVMTQNGTMNGGKPAAPATFEGARALSKRGGVEPPQRLGPTSDIKPEQEEAFKAAQAAQSQIDQEMSERFSKIAGEQGASLQTRLDLLHRMGVAPGTDPEEALDRLRSSGVPVDSPGVIEAVKANAKGGG